MSLRAAQGVNVTSMAAVDMSGEAEGVGHLGKRALVRREGRQLLAPTACERGGRGELRLAVTAPEAERSDGGRCPSS